MLFRVLLCAALIVAVGGAQTPLRLDMGPSGSPTAPGFTAVTPTTSYSPGTGYGYLSLPAAGYLRPTPTGPLPLLHSDALVRDGHEGSSDLVFRVDRPNGTYHCVAYLGDLGDPQSGLKTPRERMDILSHGNLVIDDAMARTLTGKASTDNQVGGYHRVHFLARSVAGHLHLTFHSDGTAPSLNALMGLEVYDYVEAPISFDHTTRSLVAAPAYATALAPALTAFNLHDYATAETAIAQVSDPLARAWGRAWLLGWLRGEEADVDTALLDAALADLAGLSGDDINVAMLKQDLEELALAHFHNQARGYTPSLLPGAFSNIVQNLSAAVLLFEQTDSDLFAANAGARAQRPLHAINRKLQARNMYSRGTKIGDPQSPYHAQWLNIFANEIGGNLDLFPKEHEARVFVFMAQNYGIVGGLISNWPGNTSLPALDPTTAWWAPLTEITTTQPAPAWAKAQRRYHLGFRRGGEWWMENRLISSELGGGGGDDVEGGGLLSLPTISRTENGPLEAGVAQVLSKVLFGPEVNQDQGYFANCGDVEHAGEYTTNPLFALLPSAYGDPAYLEMAMRCLRNFDDQADANPWSSVMSDGTRRFRSYIFGANSVCGPARDIPLNMRAITPGFFLQDYNASPRLIQLFDELARAWRDHAMNTSGGKPRGIFPASVSATGTPVFGTGGNWWMNGGYYDLPNQPGYHSFVYALLLSAYEKSTAADRYTLLRPIAAAGLLLDQLLSGTISGTTPGSAAWAADTLRKPIANALANARAAIEAEQAQLGLGAAELARLDAVISIESAPYLQYLQQPSTATKNKASLTQVFEDAADWQRYMFPLGTTSVTYTDRIFLMAMGSHQLLYSTLMGGDFSIVPTTTVSWGNPDPQQGELDFAALVNDVKTDAMDILYFNFESQPRDVELKVWRRLAYGTWQVSIGDDADHDDFFDSGTPIQFFNVVIDAPGKTITLPSLKAGVLQKIELRLLTPSGAGPALVPDPALSPSSLVVNAQQGTLDLSVHNLGSAAFTGGNLELWENGVLRSTTAVPALAAPLNLTPVSTMLSIPYSAQVANPSLEFRLVTSGAPQITTANDSFTVDLELPDPTLTLVPMGAPKDFDLVMDAPFDAGNGYWILVGASGDQPGYTASPGVVVPVNIDSVTTFSLGLGQTIFTGALGTLDAQGVGTLQVRIPAGVGTPGTVLWFGGLSYLGTAGLRVTNGLSFTLP